MRVFILNPEKRALLPSVTKNAIHAASPEWRCEIVDGAIGERMNAALDAYAEPFFVTLTAGERVYADFPDRAETQKRLLDADVACVRMADDDALRGPVLWRAAAVQQAGGFADSDWLPFQSLALVEMVKRLMPRWRIGEWPASWPQPAGNVRPAAWRKTTQTNGRIGPLLSSLDTPPPFQIGVPLFTVVLCAYNAADTLGWAIRSVLAQSDGDWELLIVNDGSCDDTASLLARLPDDGRIRLMTHAVNQGKARCLNEALAVSRGRWLLELDADDWLTFDCLSRMRAATANDDGECGLWYADHEEWRERPGGEPVYVRTACAAPEYDERALLDDAVPIAPRLYRTEALNSLGGWREQDPFGGRLYEDFQMIVRIARAYPVRRIPAALYHRRLRADSVTHANLDRYEAWKRWFRQASREND